MSQTDWRPGPPATKPFGMTTLTTAALNRPALGIFYICLGILAISINDMLIKVLSGGYPLHQMVFTRSAIGLVFTFGFVFAEGGLGLLKTATPGLHLLRGLLVVCANMTYFCALAVLPLGQATALFFVAPLMITLLSIPILGEKVGPVRAALMALIAAGAVVVEFAA